MSQILLEKNMRKKKKRQSLKPQHAQMVLQKKMNDPELKVNIQHPIHALVQPHPITENQKEKAACSKHHVSLQLVCLSITRVKSNHL